MVKMASFLIFAPWPLSNDRPESESENTSNGDERECKKENWKAGLVVAEQPLALADLQDLKATT